MLALPPDIPLTPEAQNLMSRILPRIQQGLEEVNRIPVSVLVWGPGLEGAHPIANVRTDLRTKLRLDGHAAYFSEELYDPNSHHSLLIQQLAQAKEFDLIVSLPSTPGSIAEVHDFVSDRRVMSRLLVFLNKLHVNGYSDKALQALSSIFSCKLCYYPNETETSIIEAETLDEVQRIREQKYWRMGRY